MVGSFVYDGCGCGENGFEGGRRGIRCIDLVLGCAAGNTIIGVKGEDIIIVNTSGVSWANDLGVLSGNVVVVGQASCLLALFTSIRRDEG